MIARILDVEPAAYHRLPGFSSTLAKILIRQSEAHARDVHERMLERIAAEDDSDGDDDDMTDDKRKRLDAGSIYHALLLGIGKRVTVIPSAILARNGAYSTTESKAARDASRAAGCIPVKEPEMPIYSRVADAIRAQLVAAGHELDGISELAIEWGEATPSGMVACRAMLDHVILHRAVPGEEPTEATIYDLKIVGDASPDRCTRTAESLGYGIQAAAYPRALNALFPSLAGRIKFRFLFCEPKRPYAIWDPILSGPFRELGERRWLRAVHAWGDGLATGRWPGFRRPGNEELSAPMWVLKQEGFTDDEI